MQQFNSIILAGGKSQRMETNKAMMHFRGKSMLQNTVDLAKHFATHTVIVSNNELHHISKINTLPDAYPNIGPLGGILAGLRNSDQDWNLILSCDMPWLDLAPLVAAFENADRTNNDAVIFRDGKNLHFLCSFYKKSLLEQMEENIQMNDYSIKGLLAKTKHQVIQIIDTSENIFTNLNDLKSLEESNLIKLEVTLFGQLKEKLELSTFWLISQAKELGQLTNEIKRDYPILQDMTFKMAINHTFERPDYPIKNNDYLAILPPFAGG